MTLYKREEHKTNVQYYGSSFKDNSTHKEMFYSTWREEPKQVNFQKNCWLGLQFVRMIAKKTCFPPVCLWPELRSYVTSAFVF